MADVSIPAGYVRDHGGYYKESDKSGPYTLDSSGTPRLIGGASGASSGQVQGAAADDAAAVGNPVLVGGKYEATPNTVEDGDASALKTDANGRLLAVAAGDVASGATDSGNPVKIGGKYNSTLPTLTTGQRGDVQLDVNGHVRTVLAPAAQATYVVHEVAAAMAATATDFLVLKNPAASGKLVRVISVDVRFAATGAGGPNLVSFYRRAVADLTVGTKTSPTVRKLDSNDGSAVGVVDAYTANPTIGAGGFRIGQARVFPTAKATQAPAAVTLGGIILVPSLSALHKGVVLREGESLNMNWEGGTVGAGMELDYTIVWAEL